MQKEGRRRLFYGWYMVMVCGLMMIVSLFLGTTVITIYTMVIAEDLGITRSAFSVFMLIKYLVAFVISLGAVEILKHIKLKNMVIIGVISTAVMLTLLSVSRNMTLVCVASVIGGIAYAFCGTIPISIVVTNWFKKSRGTAMGIVTSFSGVSGVILNPVLSSVVDKFGWRPCFQGIAAVCILSAVIVALFLKATPEEIGMKALGSEEITVTAVKTEATVEWTPDNKKKDRFNTVILVLANFLFVVGGIMVFSNYAAVLKDIGFTVLFATGTAASVCSLANCVGKFAMGWVFDKIGSKKTLIIWYTFCIISTVYFIAYRGLNVVIALIGVFIAGLVGAIFSVPIPIVASKLFPDKKTYAKAISTCSAATSLGNAVASLIFHGVYDKTGNYIASLTYSSVLAVICMALILTLIFKNKKELA